MNDQPHLRLNTGANMPALGFGTFAIKPEDTRAAVRTAIETGYRLIDTAANYKNEAEVGQAIADSGLDRGELFVTTKLWIEDYGHEHALRGFEASMEALSLEYIDLYLLHWPLPMDFERTIAAFNALEPALISGRIRALGVSNFNPEHLDELSHHTDVVPAVNQVELSPLLSQRVVKAANASRGIITEAWSPIGGQKRVGDVLRNSSIASIAEKHGKTPIQVVLRWHIQQATSSSPARSIPTISPATSTSLGSHSLTARCARSTA